MGSEVHNPAFELAVQFVNQTSRSVFLTGKAGTGKTTFLKFIRENSFKKIAVTAPTGVAAINAGGTTLHSFFQLPFGPYLPVPQPYFGSPEGSHFTDPNSLFRNIRFNAAKRDLLQELELLIIDEVSMVRADTLDAIDTILRHFRQQPQLPFGGLQMLYIGDLFQLPPVVPPGEWELLQQYYSSPFFFDARVIAQSPPACLELKKIYRQNEARFINLLNNIRNDRATPEDIEILADYYQPDFTAPKDEHFIILTTHNAKADQVNRRELDQLPGRTHLYNAAVTGDFSEKSYPADTTLSLKEGAQVMLIRNDKGESRRYYNGKIGTIRRLSTDKISIIFPDEREELVLEKETWKNIRYHYNQEKDRIEEEELGSFSQYPIRLAWAITIHKSQGLTFRKAVIDAGESFAPGQVYVALSRLTSLDGLILRSRITPHSIRTDARVAGFVENNPANEIVEQQLEQEQLVYISRTLMNAFDWTRLTEVLQTHFDEAEKQPSRNRSDAVELAGAWLRQAQLQQETAQKFALQVRRLMPDAESDSYKQLYQRTEAAASWFVRELDDQLIKPITGELSRLHKKTKRVEKEWTMLQLAAIRKRQQIQDAFRLVNGLRQGISATRLLEDFAADRTGRDPVSTAVEPTKTDKKVSTRRLSLQLYKGGTPIAGIAVRRGLTVGTIEGHLASFIATGEIDIKDLVPEDKVAPILTAIREVGGTSLGPLKNRLGADYSFGEIKAVLLYAKQLAGR